MTYRISRDGIERDMTEAEAAEFLAGLPGEQLPPMPTITAAQLRLALLGLGMTGAQVEAAIDAMPGTDMQREAARIQWEYRTSYQRDHPLVVGIGAALGLTEAQIDNAWRGAAAL
jgi:hypothetical protein